jgi:restriction system protein
MSNKTNQLWGIHAGAAGEAHDLFHNHNCIALGWAAFEDLAALPPHREAFKAEYARRYPGAKPMSIAVNAGQLFRFVHEIQAGDLIVYPGKADRLIHLGHVAGPYRYDPARSAAYPHQRAVRWTDDLPRALFSRSALYEIGSSMSLFRVKNHAAEWLAALEEEDE